MLGGASLRICQQTHYLVMVECMHTAAGLGCVRGLSLEIWSDDDVSDMFIWSSSSLLSGDAGLLFLFVDMMFQIRLYEMCSVSVSGDGRFAHPL